MRARAAREVPGLRDGLTWSCAANSTADTPVRFASLVASASLLDGAQKGRGGSPETGGGWPASADEHGRSVLLAYISRALRWQR